MKRNIPPHRTLESENWDRMTDNGRCEQVSAFRTPRRGFRSPRRFQFGGATPMTAKETESKTEPRRACDLCRRRHRAGTADAVRYREDRLPRTIIRTR